MGDNEAAAHAVVARLAELGIAARVTGGGVHWQIVVAPVGDRSILAHAFWYESAITGLMLGMNPGNRRSSLRAPVTPFDGLELATELHLDGKEVAEGRARTVDEFLAACRAWLAGATLDEMVTAAPYIGAKLRAARELGARLDPRIRWDHDPTTYEVWTYDDAGRACCVNGTACGFFYGQVQVAFGIDLSDLPAAIAAWLLDHVSSASLSAHGATIERHAELVAEDPMRWHWLHVLDRIADPEDVLAPLAPLITELARSPIASRFYTYSSLDRLCFSATSHYPWVGEFPIVALSSYGQIYVGSTRTTDVAHAVSLIEAALVASKLEPVFGAAAHHQLPVIAAALARAGSARVPALSQFKQWVSVVVKDGARHCSFHEREVSCNDGTLRWTAECRTIDDAVAIALRFLDDNVSTSELASDPRVKSSR